MNNKLDKDSSKILARKLFWGDKMDYKEILDLNGGKNIDMIISADVLYN